MTEPWWTPYERATERRRLRLIEGPGHAAPLQPAAPARDSVGTVGPLRVRQALPPAAPWWRRLARGIYQFANDCLYWAIPWR